MPVPTTAANLRLRVHQTAEICGDIRGSRLCEGNDVEARQNDRPGALVSLTQTPLSGFIQEKATEKKVSKKKKKKKKRQIESTVVCRLSNNVMNRRHSRALNRPFRNKIPINRAHLSRSIKKLYRIMRLSHRVAGEMLYRISTTGSDLSSTDGSKRISTFMDRSIVAQ